MSSGVFRGKESLNRIKLSRLVQDLLNFGVLGSLWLWGGGRWMGGCLEAWGVSQHMYTCTHTHMYACTCIHVQKLQMATDMEASMFIIFIMFNMHVHACVHVSTCICMHACMGHLPHTHTHPHPIHPPATSPSGASESVKNSITLELIKIFQFCLKI